MFATVIRFHRFRQRKTIENGSLTIFRLKLEDRQTFRHNNILFILRHTKELDPKILDLSS